MIVSPENSAARRRFLKVAGATSFAAMMVAACGGVAETPTPKDVPIPPETEDMHKLVAELNALLPGANPTLQYLRAGKYNDQVFGGLRQVDSYYIVFNTGESLDNAKGVITALSKGFTYMIQTNERAGDTQSLVLLSEHLRRLKEDPEWSLDRPMPDQSGFQHDYVYLAINGNFYGQQEIHLLRMAPSEFAYNLQPYKLSTVQTGETNTHDFEILAMDAASRMSSTPTFPAS